MSAKRTTKGRQSAKGESRQQRSKCERKTWACTICRQQIDYSQSFCFMCYQSLYYYSYINMHLFVESDHSFCQIYFPNPYLPKPTRDHSTQPTAESQDEQDDQVDLNWVENILQGE